MAANMNYRNFGRSQPPPAAADGGGSTLLSRQTSIYSLTFDELQSTMGGTGKDFGSMNMDELLKNIWSAEEMQTMASAGGGLDGNGGLPRQGSLTLPRTLSQKTVDEVWKDISKEYSFGKDGIGTAGTNNDDNMSQRQQTLGEMTLEEFLVRAGVVREDAQFAGKVNNVDGGFFDGFQQAGRGPNLMGNRISEGGNQIGFQASNLPFNVNGVNSNHNQLAQQQTQHNHHYQQQRHQQPIFPKQPVVGFGSQLGNPGNRGGTTGIGDQGLSNGIHGGGLGMDGLGSPVGVPTRSPANRLLSNGIGKSSADNYSLSPVPYVFTGSLRGRKSSAVERVVERRQRRMIKNRESAARSRARKQAYTTELEEEVAKLKDANEGLQKQNAEIMEMQKNKALETMDMQQGAKKRCLRRTVTGPW